MMNLMLRERIKWLLFPGTNLHAHLRYRVLPQYFGHAENGRERTVLDAGCGNGMLSYQAYLRGNRVLGISIKEGEIRRNQKLFNKYLGIPPERLAFRLHNLYAVEELDKQFDEIICTEVLEHIARDQEVCRSFFRILKPGGVLHLCCPNAEHPDHVSYELDEGERGGHVRSGYTAESYRALLTPIGFELSEPLGLGGPVRQGCNKRVLAAQKIAGLPLSLPVSVVGRCLQVFDVADPKVPYSLYVRATKPVPAEMHKRPRSSQKTGHAR